MRSVEFLVAVALLLVVYGSLYRLASTQKAAAEEALRDFNDSIRYRCANAIVANLIAYGEPFEYADFEKLDPSRLKGVRYDPATNRYTYRTYPRW